MIMNNDTSRRVTRYRLIRAVLALNAFEPFALRGKCYRIAVTALGHGNLDRMTEEEREIFRSYFSDVWNVPLDRIKLPYCRID